MGYRNRLLKIAIIVVGMVVSIACYGDLPSDLHGLTAAMESSDMGVQAAAAERIDRQFGKTGLLTALRDGGPGARAQAARRLSRFKDLEVLQALIPVAQRDANRQARYAAISALGLIGDRQARDALIGMKQDSDPLVREGVQDALRQLDRAAK